MKIIGYKRIPFVPSDEYQSQSEVGVNSGGGGLARNSTVSDLRPRPAVPAENRGRPAADERRSSAPTADVRDKKGGVNLRRGRSVSTR